MAWEAEVTLTLKADPSHYRSALLCYIVFVYEKCHLPVPVGLWARGIDSVPFTLKHPRQAQDTVPVVWMLRLMSFRACATRTLLCLLLHDSWEAYIFFSLWLFAFKQNFSEVDWNGCPLSVLHVFFKWGSTVKEEWLCHLNWKNIIKNSVNKAVFILDSLPCIVEHIPFLAIETKIIHEFSISLKNSSLKWDNIFKD